jgi:MinD-like ATPase involved in chromosome partitioning or flagellar assembly
MRGLAVAVYSERRSAEVVAIAARLAHAIAQRIDAGRVALVDTDRSGHDHVNGSVALEPVDELEPARIHGRLTALRDQYHVLVLAVTGGWTERVFALLDASHRVLLVVEPIVASIRAVQRALKMCSSVGFSAEKVQLVLHGFTDEEAISSVEAVAALKRDVFGKLEREGAEDASTDQGYGSLAARLLERQ